MEYPADLRPPHRRVLAEIAMQDEISRNDLTAQLELPRATVTSLVRDLIARGLVVTRESAVTGRRGRPAEILALAGPPTVIGVLSPAAEAVEVLAGSTGENADLLGAVALAQHEAGR